MRLVCNGESPVSPQSVFPAVIRLTLTVNVSGIAALHGLNRKKMIRKDLLSEGGTGA